MAHGACGTRFHLLRGTKDIEGSVRVLVKKEHKTRPRDQSAIEHFVNILYEFCLRDVLLSTLVRPLPHPPLTSYWHAPEGIESKSVALK